jgi:hypothetical protein
MVSFTITRNLEQLSNYAMLCKLADQNQVRVTGNECTGSFSCRGVAGNYEFGEAGVLGKFAGRGVTGEFSFKIGRAAVTITGKPFWVSEMFLKQKITAGLDAFCNKLA